MRQLTVISQPIMMNVIEEKMTMHISYSIKPFQMKAWYQGAGKRPQPTLAFFFCCPRPKGPGVPYIV